MKEELFITFDESWFPKENTVAEILQKLDMGEKVSLSKLKEACEKEGIEFNIIFD